MKDTDVIIAGAGPGGLVAALALHQRGIGVRVFESVQALKPLGVGINLLPHSVRILHGLGLQAELERIAVLTSELRYTNKFGQLIWAEPRGLAAGYAYPQYSIHRGLLQILLLDVARERLARWTHGRMTLLGDAAHPMYPIGSNGASQAILDALHAYEAARRPATFKLEDISARYKQAAGFAINQRLPAKQRIAASHG
ncbi:MAG: FAD-binding protein [Anaerolineae bacterium]|nr:FAD-binding protein [Anaerolineae bacterium]